MSHQTLQTPGSTIPMVRICLGDISDILTDFQTLAFFEVFMGLLCFIYLICSIRTNLCFVVIFLALTLGFSFLAGTSWQLANGNADLSRSLKKVGTASFCHIRPAPVRILDK